MAATHASRSTTPSPATTPPATIGGAPPASASPTSTTPTTAPPLSAASAGSSIPGSERERLLSARCKNPGGEPPKKPRTIISAKTNAMVRSTGKKIELKWSTFHHGPETKEVFEGLVRNIGAAVRSHVPMLAPSFKKLEEHQRDIIFAYLENFYEIDPKDDKMMKFILGKASDIYRNWKYFLRRHYNTEGSMASEFENRKDEWDWLVKNEFEDEKKKALCEKNKANRTKNPNAINHHSGPCPMSFRAEELLKKGSPAPLVETALNMYIQEPKANEQVQKLKRTIDKLYEQYRPGESQNGEAVDQVHPDSISFEEQCDILIDAFGERRGTKVRGLGGAGSRPPKKRGGANLQAVAIRLELEARAKKAEEETKNAREEAKLAIAENEALKSRISVLEDFMTTFAKSQTPSQPSPSQGNTP